MKINEPVTQNEIPFPEGKILVSKTNLKGAITYANKDFVEISGFGHAELIGQNHNMVRHPDMPPEAFQDLWDTVQAGRPWIGLVKNRAKNGDYYWVKANVTPVTQNGQIVEYMSVRSRPERHEIQAAEKLYSDINAGKATLPKPSRYSLSNMLKNMSLPTKFTLIIGSMLLPILLMGYQMWQNMEHSDALVAELSLIGLVVAFGLFVAFSVGSNMTRSIKGIVSALSGMKEGVFDIDAGESSYDELGDAVNYLKMTQTNLRFDLADARAKADESLRIRNALDNVSANVMMADNSRNIIYMNKAVSSLFNDLENDIRGELPNFRAGQLMGANIDDFHKNPQHQISLLEKLTDTYESQLELGGLTLKVVANPVINDQGERLGTVVEWSDLTEMLARQAQEEERLEEERRLASENQRIRVALDNVSSNVMLANPEREIIYLNKNAQKLFNGAEADIRKDLPNFSASNLLGTNIDGFHRNPTHQSRLLEQLSSTYEAEMEIGGRTMRIIANPVIDEDGSRLGTAVEWTDRTQEVAVEHEIDSLVEAASAGDLTSRLDTTDKSGFFLQLSNGFNALLDQLTSVFEDIGNVMEHMAKGDLTQTITREYQGTFGEVKENINKTIGNVEETVERLRDISDQVGIAADEISTGNTNLSSRTEQQAANLEQTAASMEELTSTVKNNSDNAQQANHVATTARGAAEKGGDVVNQAVSAMQQISESSNRIAEIIGVIDEIAFQTNLLALNASVEAARAGEQGRGFAVVATEVRNLASRSAEAAKEIKELIKDSVEKVSTGSGLVNQTGESLQEIVDGVKKVGDIIAEIAAASAEQSSGIEQVNMAITNMDEMTQQNAALAEQTSAASAAMSDNASGMQAAMDFFKTSASRAVASAGGSSIARAAQLAKPAAATTENTVEAAASRPAPDKPEIKTAAKPIEPKPTTPPSTNDDDEWEEF